MKQHVIVIAALGICMGAGSAEAYFSYMPSISAPAPQVSSPPPPPVASTIPVPPPATTVTPLPVQPLATTAEAAPPITPAPASPPASGVVEKALQESATATGNLAPDTAPLPVTPFAAPVVAAEEWALRPAPLRNQLGVWAERAGYELVWKAENDYHLEYQTSFRGSLTEALQQLFGALHKQGAPLRVTLYETNKIITVIEE